jgi:hypothetical protein
LVFAILFKFIESKSDHLRWKKSHQWFL